MKTPRQVAGQRAEDHALAYLEQQGLRLLERNYRCPLGEIDLIMDDGRGVVFVEVRYRRDNRYGGALESVDRRKQAKLLGTATWFLQERQLDRPSRFDVAALAPSGAGFAINWVRDAFQAG